MTAATWAVYLLLVPFVYGAQLLLLLLLLLLHNHFILLCIKSLKQT
jgi:hypothetical protein